MQIIKAILLFLNKIRKIVKKTFWTKLVQLTCKQYGQGLTVNARSWMGGNVVIGKNCHFNGMNISGGGLVSIGDNFHSAADCEIIVSYHNYDTGQKIPYDDSLICKTVVIEDNVWVGYRVIILGGVKIGEGAIIQAGSVVVSDIPEYAIAGGNPARVFKMRDIDHYEKLKKQGKFH